MVEEDLWDMDVGEGVQVQEKEVEDESTKILWNAISVTNWDTIRMSVLCGRKMQTMQNSKKVNCFLWIKSV